MVSPFPMKSIRPVDADISAALSGCSECRIGRSGLSCRVFGCIRIDLIRFHLVEKGIKASEILPPGLTAGFDPGDRTTRYDGSEACEWRLYGGGPNEIRCIEGAQTVSPRTGTIRGPDQ